MLSSLCKELNNWFDTHRYFGAFTISDGALEQDLGLQEGQYFRIVGSTFNDGVYQYPAEDLKEEQFEGAIWAMAIPAEVIALAAKIEEWQAKYGGVDSENMSPYNSESFGGYSYSKGGGGSSDGSSAAGTWQGAFASELKKYRKVHPF